jgi:stage IV sporulation protein B
MNHNKTKNGWRVFLSCALTLVIAAAAVAGIGDFVIPGRMSVYSGTGTPTLPFCTLEATDTGSVAVFSDSSDDGIKSFTACAKLLGLIPIKNVSVDVYDQLLVYPGGMPFGVKLHTQGVIVVGIASGNTSGDAASPAYNAGIRVKDIITAISGKPVNSIEEVTAAVEASGGKPLDFTVTRGDSEYTFKVTPGWDKAENKYKAGIWIRDSTAGIGTITYIIPSTLQFGGLGHGICDVDTGDLMPLLSGTVSDVTISGITRGRIGLPGELKGYFGADRLGSLIANTNAGVYGVLNSMPEQTASEPIPIALRSEVQEGEATIYTTLDGNNIGQYTVQISNINRTDGQSKSFVVTITDPKLLELTGGIVQGMSGSPIIQNGKLIGAVTHVMINDPTKGYGIFIESMLSNSP